MSSQAQNICMKKAVKGNRKKKKKNIPIVLRQLISSLTKNERKEKCQAKGKKQGQHSRTELSSFPSIVLLQLDELQAFPSTLAKGQHNILVNDMNQEFDIFRC